MKRQKRGSRRGLVLVCVIACLVVSSALVGLAVQSALRGRREARLQLQLRQTELLCEAGVLRATKQLQVSESYTGEEWRPELSLENYHDAEIQIEVTAVDPDTSQSNQSSNQPANQSSKKVTVIAKLDSYLDQDGPMQRTYNFLVPVRTKTNSTEKQ